MAALAIALGTNIFLVAHVVFGSNVAAIATGLVALRLGLVWWAVPLWIPRRRQARDRERQPGNRTLAIGNLGGATLDLEAHSMNTNFSRALGLASNRSQARSDIDPTSSAWIRRSSDA